MTSYAAIFDVTPPEKFDRVQLLVRFLISIVLGIVGISMGWVFLLAYFALPLTAAIAVNAIGAEGFQSRTGPVIEALVRWLLSLQAYMCFLGDRFPSSEETMVRYQVYPTGKPTMASALWRLLTSLPEIIVLIVLSIPASIVWVLSFLFVLFTAAVPGGLLAFQRGLLRWQARLFAYHASLVETAPPYALDVGPESPPARA